MEKISLTYYTKEDKVVDKLSDAVEVLIVGSDGLDGILGIDTESRRNALPKDLSNVEGFYSFTEKERIAFNQAFGIDDDEKEEELKTAASAGEKFKPDTWEEPN